LWPLYDRRGQLRETVAPLPETIRYSETFNLPLSEFMRPVRKHQLEGIVAKLAAASTAPSSGSTWRANRGREFVIGGYIPNGKFRVGSLLSREVRIVPNQD
jgi:ATP-dependent DNA ligase